jgi:hypothetical protein
VRKCFDLRRKKGLDPLSCIDYRVAGLAGAPCRVRTLLAPEARRIVVSGDRGEAGKGSEGGRTA